MVSERGETQTGRRESARVGGGAALEVTERRFEARQAVNARAEVSGPDGRMLFTGVVRNAAPAGLFVEVEEWIRAPEIPSASIIIVEIMLADGQVERRRGVIVWSTATADDLPELVKARQGFGIELLDCR